MFLFRMNNRNYNHHQCPSSINTRLSTNMAHPIKDSFLDLGRYRPLLEDNIAKMRKSLQYWQIWEAEYEGLKEEILAAKPLLERPQLLIIRR
jgi:unconventional prefoldin RPB5 interactor 1